jgi:hypothetical protein
LLRGKDGGATSFIDCRENVGTASWQESSLTQKRSEREREREREREEKIIKPKGEEEYNALPCVQISRKLLPLCAQS